MKSVCLVSVFVVVSLLSGALARGDANTNHVSTMKMYCSGQGYCARMSNGTRNTMAPSYTMETIRFNPVDGEPIR